MSRPASIAPVTPRRTAALFLALALATTVTLVVTQHHRQGTDIVNTVRLDRLVNPETGNRAKAEFNLTRADDRATVSIVDREGELVRTYQRAEPIAARRHTYFWDGRGDDGELADPGRYRLRLQLLGQGRDILLPGTLQIKKEG